MKPVVFRNREEVAALITRLTQFNMLDDWVLQNPAVWATSALFYYLESVSGIVVMDGIIPNREASCHIFLFEKPGARCSLMIKELRKEIKKYFRMFGLKRLSGHIPEYNKPSRRLAVALGFKLEGIKRKAGLVHGKYGDLCVYSIIDTDLTEVKKNGGELGKHPGPYRIGTANDGPSETADSGTGLHQEVERNDAKEDGGWAAVDISTGDVWYSWILRIYRKAFGIADSNAKNVRP